MTTTMLPRLLAGHNAPLNLSEYESTFLVNPRADSLLSELDASGLTGRGGSGFPTAQKVRLLRALRGRHKVVVVNAMEGEPASRKDVTLLRVNPHLVLDGAEALASLIGANEIIVCIAREKESLARMVREAIAERVRHHRRSVRSSVQTPPGRYVAGEETALVNWLNNRETLPQYRAKRPHVARLSDRAVLVDNAETCAHVGFIARAGAESFRSLGTDTSPGSALVSISGAIDRPQVLEVALGTPLRQILVHAGADPDPQALLLGGYGGAWLDAAHLDTLYANETLAPLGASTGAGVIVVLARDGCAVAETERIVRWMANESARQCGPCAFGLPSLAEDLALLRQGASDASLALERLASRCGVIDGRGACHHPDGVVRFVRSALRVFRDDIADHASGRPCIGSGSARHYATVPNLEREAELTWQ
jgi:NADH:ubiquinone oxidoreductase subunit F (NADH-binding)